MANQQAKITPRNTIPDATNNDIVKKLNVNKGHKFITGMTQSGKTHLAKSIMRAWSGPVIFFNPQSEKAKGLSQATPETYFELIKTTLNDKGKVNFVPSYEPKQAQKELAVIEYICRSKTWNNLLVVIDECDDYNGQLHYFAKRSLGKNITTCFISQTPADVTKSVIKMCQHHVIFKINQYDSQYYKNYNLPGEKIEELTAKQPYNFVVWDNQELYGPFRI